MFTIVMLLVGAAALLQILEANVKCLEDFTKWLEKKTVQMKDETKQMEDEIKQLEKKNAQTRVTEKALTPRSTTTGGWDFEG